MEIDPINLFRRNTEEYQGMYSKFNEEMGIPTHAADGTELTKKLPSRSSRKRSKST